MRTRRTFLISAAAIALLTVLAVALAIVVRDDAEEPAPSGAPTTEAPPDDPAESSDEYSWEPVAIGGGGFVTGIVSGVAPDRSAVIYARTDVGGAYRWDEATASWMQLVVSGSLVGGRLHPNDYSVASIAVAPSNPDVVVIAVGNDANPDADGGAGERQGRVLWSNDGGSTWSSSSQRWTIAGNQSYRTGRELLAIDPTNPDRALFGTQREGLWSTDDAGATWQHVPDRDVPSGVTDDPTSEQAGVSSVSFVSPGTDATPVAVAGVTGEGVFASTDLEAWVRVAEIGDDEMPSSTSPVGDGLLMTVNTPGRAGARLLQLGPFDPAELSATTVDEITTPAAASTFIVAAAPASGSSPATLALTDEAVRDGHFWTSTDDGATWTTHDIEITAPTEPWLASTDLDDYMSAGALMFDPVSPTRLWFAEGMGVWRTDAPTDTDVTWTAVSKGIEEVVVSDIVVPPDGDLLITVADRQGFRIEGPGVPPERTLVDERFASGSSIDFSGGSPQRLAWVGAQSNLSPQNSRPRGATSSDGGRTWTEMSGLRQGMYGGEVAVSATDPERILWVAAPFDGRDPDGIHLSSDGGSTWTVGDPPSGDEMDVHRRNFWWFGRRALAADRVDGTFYLMGDQERLDVSSDGGTTWEPAEFAPPCRMDTDCHVFGQLRAVPGRAGHLVASTGRGGLVRTTDAGASRWEELGRFTDARAFGFGAPVGDSDEPTIFVHASTSSHPNLALWRSTDGGENWVFIADHPGGIAAGVNAVTGDPAVPGRVYVGFAGVGAVKGEDDTLG